MDKDKTATANFVKPILWLHANSPDSSMFYPYQVKIEKDTVLVQEIILEVNDVDDWQLTEIRFKAEGTGNEPVDIYRAFLVGPGYSQWKQYSQNDGLLRFIISKTIPKGQSVKFRLYYDYSHNLLEPVDTLKTYRVKINTTMVEAKPVHYENYQKLPSEWMFSNPIELANVINKTRKIGYVKIKDAAAQAKDGDQIEVGPGEYDEHSIKIGKKDVSVYSYKGLEFTIIKPTTADSSILCVEESGVSIRGFNINCGNGKEGIDSRDNRYLKIENCQFDIDDYCETGIYAVRTKNLEINDCTMQANNNALSGIWIGNCCNVTIQRVNVSFVKTIKDIDPVFNAIDGFECDSVSISHVLIRRCRNGIKFQKSSNVEIVTSFIRENLDDGISITDCKSIRIIGNKAESGGLLNNYKNGISLSNSDNCWIERNDIRFNQWGWISLYGGRGTFIRDNGIIGNPLHGTQGISISGGKGYISNNNSVCGNQVSRSLSGIFIKESRGDRIFCNDFFQNTFGVSLSGSNNIEILFNNIKENRHGISSENSTYTMRGNVVDDNGDETPGTNYSAHTGVHLFQSSARIIGNSIHNDNTDGIIFEQGSSGTVTDNMIYANQGAGLKNLDPSVTITATGNWWGDASGPAGIGPGKGDEVEGTVDFSNWLAEPLGVRVYVERDTVYARPASQDSLYVSFRNWRKARDVLNVTITDPLGWVSGPKQFQVTVVDSLPNAQTVIFAVPADAPAGASDQVTVRAVSQWDPSLQHEANLVIRSYTAVLRRIKITPDSVRFGQGHRRQ
ncbi:MAG: right-handed parallel beta-helix repeat-containing protein, partial [candidate division KSB1 bacterium]|nr:right-handed parallel beta-helix repeat-containing protein [candidate division KSB1 bacterium]